MEFQFKLMTEELARAIGGWRYESPYTVYSIDPADVGFMLDPANCYFAICDERDALVGFCCVGPDARVPGGDYPEEAADIGLGMRPELTGRGVGGAMVAAIVRFVEREFAPPMLRLTVAMFNLRAIKVYTRAGFAPVRQFLSPSGSAFLVMVRPTEASTS